MIYVNLDNKSKPMSYAVKNIILFIQQQDLTFEASYMTQRNNTGAVRIKYLEQHQSRSRQLTNQGELWWFPAMAISQVA